MVGLARSMLVQVLVVDGTPRAAVVLGHHHHAALPPGWCVQWDTFQYPKLKVSVQSLLNSQLPVEGNLGRDMDSYWRGLGVNMKLEGWSTGHEG